MDDIQSLLDGGMSAMWAAAVLHWQRAVGRASGHTGYLRRLAHGYARLGFYRRSLDTLAMALAATQVPKIRREIEAELAQVQRRSQAAAERRE